MTQFMKRGAKQRNCHQYQVVSTRRVLKAKDALKYLKLSTKCRQLETPKWELPKKFPFWHGLNVKGELPSPLHNPPMRVYALPHKFVYSLSTSDRYLSLNRKTE